VFLQGDGNIRYFEITTEKPYIQYLMEFRSPAPQKGLGESRVDQQQMILLPEQQENSTSLAVFRDGGRE